MGFFQDLKEDLSQAVNELMPEEAKAEGMPVLDAQAEEAAQNQSGEAVQADEPEEDLEAALSAALAKLPETGEDDMAEEVLEEKEPQQEETQEEPPAPAGEEIPDEPEEVSLQAEEAETETEPVEEEPIEEEPEKPAEAEQEKLQEEPEEEEPEEDEDILQAIEEEKMIEEEVEEAMENEKLVLEEAETEEMIDETAAITGGMIINGDLVTKGSVEILGTINGNVEALGKLSISGAVKGNSTAAEIFADSAKITGEVHSKGSVKIGQSSVIIGNIYATSAVVAGAVKGDIDVQGPVILDTSAIVMGNIKSKAVQINNGAVIEGMVSQCYADVSPTSFFSDYSDPNTEGKKKGK